MTDQTCMYWWFGNVRLNGLVMDTICDMLHECAHTPQAAAIA